jgi:hypothetical protein
MHFKAYINPFPLTGELGEFRGSPDALTHRTNTGPRIRQTAIRVSDMCRYLRPADGITVVGVREGRQQARGGGQRSDVLGPDLPGAHRKKGEE